MKNFSEFIIESSLVNKMKQRIEDHIERVQYFYDTLIDLDLIPKADQNAKEVAKHDQDKLKKENLERQALRFKANTTPEEIDKINAVIREHVKSNPHHCEYYGTASQDHRSTHINCMGMPAKHLYEMLADWAATSEEKGNTILEYYYDVEGTRYLFADWQKEIIEEIATVLEQYKDNNLKRKYSKVYLDPGYSK